MCTVRWDEEDVFKFIKIMRKYHIPFTSRRAIFQLYFPELWKNIGIVGAAATVYLH